MSRGFSAEYAAALNDKVIRPLIFVQAQFADGTLYMCSAPVAAVWNGQTWLGAGKLGQISTATESTDIRAGSITLSLSGFDNAILAEALNQCRTNLPASVWLGLVRADGSIIPYAPLIFSGLIDVPSVKMDSATSTISITVETRAARMKGSDYLKYTDEDQQSLYPGDRGFMYSGDLNPLLWGGTQTSTGTKYGSGTVNDGPGGKSVFI